MQKTFESNLISRIYETKDYGFARIMVLVEYKTPFGFEIITNLLRDDGNEEKDVRKAMLSTEFKQITIFHEQHLSLNMMTVIVLLGEKINRWEFEDKFKDRLNFEEIGDVTADATQLAINAYNKNEVMEVTY